MRRALHGLALLTGLLALGYVADGLKYPLGTAAQPGPGIYPLLVGGLLLLASIGLGVEASTSPPQGEVDWPRSADLRRVAGIIASILGYVILLPIVGHPIVGTLATLSVLHVVGLPSRPAKFGLALALGLGSYYLFARILGVPLPAGPLP